MNIVQTAVRKAPLWYATVVTTAMGTLLCSGCSFWHTPTGPLFSVDPASIVLQSTPLPETHAGQKVAILLPVTGPHAERVAWISQGIGEARARIVPEKRPEIYTIDTRSESPQDMKAAERRLRALKPDWVIGPITRTGTNWMAEHASDTSLPPQLWLNHPKSRFSQASDEAPPPHWIFHWGGPDEIFQAVETLRANEAWVFLPQHSETAENELRWLQQAWAYSGKGALHVSRYPARDPQIIHEIIQLDSTHWQAPDTPTASATPSELPAIFLLGNRRDILLIKPLLNLYGAGHLPVIGTARALATHSEQAEPDFNGMQYCAAQPTGHGAEKALAFGQDSWDLARWFFAGNTRAVGSGNGIIGQTGYLLPDTRHRVVHRRVPCFIWENGRPVPLETKAML